MNSERQLLVLEVLLLPLFYHNPSIPLDQGSPNIIHSHSTVLKFQLFSLLFT